MVRRTTHPVNRAPDVHARPVLLVHGLFDRGHAFRKLARLLAAHGWRPHTIDLQPNDGRMGLDRLARQVDAYAAEHFADGMPFDLIGFSMGGLVCRYYVQRLGGLHRIRRLITLATPHRGSWLAHLLPLPAAVQMRPGSAFLDDLNRDAAELERVGVQSIWTPWDLMVVPGSSGRLPVGRAVRLPVALHPWMLTSPRSLALILRLLADEPEDAPGAGC
jgi:triacylglycerol lipase